MSKSTQSAARADLWYERYLDLGPERSIKKLAVEARRICGENGEQHAPAERTLESWSSRYGWDRRARSHEADVRQIVRQRLINRRADVEEERVEIALSHTQMFHALVRDALVREFPVIDPRTGEQVFTVQNDGSTVFQTETRMVRFSELSKTDIYTLGYLHKLAVSTEQSLVSGSSDRRQKLEDEMGENGPTINVLGPEAIREMTMSLGAFVRRASANAERNIAAKQQVIDQEPEDDDFEAEDEWEEIPDDE